MHPRYPKLFSPIRLGPVELPNRFFFAPHGSALSAGTKPSSDLVAYSTERVKDGGCGLVIVAIALHERARTRQPSAHPPENVAAWRVMADSIHAAGGKIFAETLYHWTGGGWWQPLSPPAVAFGASVRQYAYGGRGHSTREMTLEEIRAMLAAIEQSARNLSQAGFDGIMLHASHSALLEQFLSPYFNERTDEYGGNLENRMRFAAEALAAAKKGGGPDFAVGMRFNCNEQIAGGYGEDTAREVVRTLCERGLLDYIDLDVGLEPQQYHHGMPTGFVAKQYYRPFVERVRKAAGNVPVLSVLGSVTDLSIAEEALQAGVCDVAGAARQLIAEPRFVQNAYAGTEELSRTCIACNWCTAAGGDGAQGCAINPASYRERLWGMDSFAPAATAKRLVVVGGGPGGMEAARVARLQGHNVTLIEARERLGGALALWAELPGRDTYAPAASWWRAEMERLGVDVRLSTLATREMVLELGPDAVILATGATYCTGGRSITLDADIPGHDLPHVFRPEQILLDGVRPTGRVVMIDAEGYHTGTGIAEMLAGNGAQVQFVTAGYSPVSGRLTDSWEERHVVKRLKEGGVVLRPTTWVRKIGPNSVLLYDMHTGVEREESADAVVLVTGRVPQDALARELEGAVPQVYVIGDALAARMLAAAPYEGQKFARLVGSPDAPRTTAEAFFQPDDPSVNLAPADMALG